MVRYSVYLLMLIVLTELIVLVPHSCGSVSLASEHSMVECLQILLLLVSSTLLAFAAHRFPDQTALAHLLMIMLLLFTVRELDLLMDTLLFNGAWQLEASLLFLCGMIYTVRHHRAAVHNVQRFVQCPACGILLSGLLILLVFSRLFGQRILWRSIMGDQYMRLVKNAAEEETELLGYFLIVIAVIEWLAFLYTRRPSKLYSPSH
jgi:hypothetical protein